MTAILAATMGVFMSILAFTGTLMLYLAYKETGTFGPSSLLDDYYPFIYIQAAYILIAALGCYFFYIPIGYIHVCDYVYIIISPHISHDI